MFKSFTFIEVVLHDFRVKESKNIFDIHKLLNANGCCHFKHTITYISISIRGKAVVDYVCVNHDVLDQCLDFKI